MAVAIGMVRKSRTKTKGRRESGSFAAFPRACWEHRNYAELPIQAKALLHELNGQYNGKNNGDLCAAWGTVKDRGLGCRATVDRARDELERAGWIVLTRQGGRNAPNLYALTFHSVDECGGKLDAGATAGRPLGYWKNSSNPQLSARLRRYATAA